MGGLGRFSWRGRRKRVSDRMFLQPGNVRSSRKECGRGHNYAKNGERQRPDRFAAQPPSTLLGGDFGSTLCRCWPCFLLCIYWGATIAGLLANLGNEAIAATRDCHDIAV